MKRNCTRVLVTGGAGFLGSRLCERLLDEGCDVLCVDNFFTGSKANITRLLMHPHFELLRHDITFPLYVEVDEIYLSLAEHIIRLTRSKSELVFNPLPQDDPAQRRSDISLARNQLNWQPTVPLEDGLNKTIEYFQRNLSAFAEYHGHACG